jgi:hypothetical protein
MESFENHDKLTAFLFSNADRSLLAVTLDPCAKKLPHPEVNCWNFAGQFKLGEREFLPFKADPDSILRGLAVDGYFVWPTEPMSVSRTSS